MENEKQEMLDFLKLIRDCTLSVDQKLKWLKKFRGGSISEADYEEFHDDVEASLNKAHREMEKMSEGIGRDQKEVEALESEAMKEFNEMYPRLVTELEKEVADFEAEADEVTDGVFAEVEGKKGAKDAEEIENIKGKLGI